MWVWDKFISGEKHTTQGRDARGHMAQPGNRSRKTSLGNLSLRAPHQEQKEQSHMDYGMCASVCYLV